MNYLEQLVQGIKSSKDWEKVAEYKVSLAVETLFQGQQLAINSLHRLYGEM
jgi:hypothetical protein